MSVSATMHPLSQPDPALFLVDFEVAAQPAAGLEAVGTSQWVELIQELRQTVHDAVLLPVELQIILLFIPATQGDVNLLLIWANSATI